MAVAHSDRGKLDSTLARPLRRPPFWATERRRRYRDPRRLQEHAAALGADAVVVLPDLDAVRFEPEREVVAVSSLIRAYDARHVVLPDKPESDGDLGRRLIVGSIGNLPLRTWSR